MRELEDLLTKFEEIHENTEDIPVLKDLLEEILDRVTLQEAESSSAGEAVGVLFKALGWDSGGLGSAAIAIVARVDELLESNTKLVLENRELKAELANWRC